MRTNFQRVGALLLILAMLLCYMPGMAFADESETAATQAVDTIATGTGDPAVFAIEDGGEAADIQVTETGANGTIEVSIGGTIHTSVSESQVTAWWVEMGIVAPDGAKSANFIDVVSGERRDRITLQPVVGKEGNFQALIYGRNMWNFTEETFKIEWLGDSGKIGENTYHLKAKDLVLAPYQAEIVDFGYGLTSQDVKQGMAEGRNENGIDAPFISQDFLENAMWITLRQPIPRDIVVRLDLTTPNGTIEELEFEGAGDGFSNSWSYQDVYPSVQVGTYTLAPSKENDASVEVKVEDDTATVPPLKNAPIVNWKGSGFESKAADVKAAIEAATGESDPSRKITDDMVYAVCQLDWSQVGAPYGSGNTLTYNVIHNGTIINSQPIASSTPGTVFNFTLGGEKDKMAGIYIIEICKDDVAIATQVIDVYAVTYEYQAGKGVQEFADTAVLVGASKLEAAKNGKLADAPQVELEDDKGQLQWVESGDAADPHHITLVATDGEKAEVERLRKGVENTKITLSSKSNKKGIRLDWKRSKGFKVDYYEVFKSLKRSTGSLGKAAYYKTTTGTRNYYIDTKKLKKGTRYYYRVRGVRALADGTTAYTKWSNWAWRKSPVTRS